MTAGADLIYSLHADRKLRRLNLPRVAARHVFGDYDACIERDDNCRELTGSWEGRRLTVVVTDDTDPPKVVTVFDLGKGG